MEMLLYLVFFGLIAAGQPCEITVECDTACTYLKSYLENNTVTNTTYRLKYHVSTPIGWMNDPNGFSYYKGNYHIFYQYYPFDSVWGPMHWGHSTSPDLVTWTTQQTALLPDTEWIFSGSGIVYGTTLILMYTGHVNGTVADESQYLAFSDDGVNFLKYSGNPVLTYSTNGSTDFRDPKVWQYGSNYYVVIGSKTSDNRGTVRLYSSADLLTWTFRSVIAEASANLTQASVYMLECPDFFELDGQFVLLMSPQGMVASGDRYKNLYQTGYILGSFDYDTCEFTPSEDFQELDYGHDFYATQTIERNGVRYLSAWFGMWNSTFPEAAHGWAGALTIFRELTLSGTRILQTPVAAMTELREAAVLNGTLDATNGTILLNETGELIVSANWTLNVEITFEGQTDGGGSLTLSWNASSTTVALNRDEDIRQMTWTATDDLTWRIFLDTSSIELFCGIGDVVFSTRVYPLGGWKITNLSTQDLTVIAMPLTRSVPEP